MCVWGEFCRRPYVYACRKHPPELQDKQEPSHASGFTLGSGKDFSRIYNCKFSSGKLHAEFFVHIKGSAI